MTDIIIGQPPGLVPRFVAQDRAWSAARVQITAGSRSRRVPGVVDRRMWKPGRPITSEMTQWLIFQALPRSATTVSLEFVATAAMSIVASTFVNDRYAGAR